MHILDSHESRSKFLQDRDMIYYRIVGGLGNQLFGLSRAYLLHKEIGKRIAIDVSNLDHTSDSGPDWKDWDGLEGWSELIKSPKNVTPPNQLQNLLDSPKEENSNTSFYTGWKFSLEEVFRSGLFLQGELPFSTPTVKNPKVGMHLRGGDYRQASGIGLLSKAYYRRALQAFQITEGQEITVFSDDPEYANTITEEFKSQFSFILSDNISSLHLLAEMSSSETFIGSNSTLSWWATFFSKNSLIALPKPMYLQGWFADREIHLDKVYYFDRFPNKLIKVYNYVKWQCIPN